MARTAEIKERVLQDLICMGFGKDTIAGFFCVSDADIDEYCKNRYKSTFDEIIGQIHYAGNINQDKDRPYTVYMHIAPNGKKYIGITKSKLNKRWENGKGYWANKHFSNAINLYGWDNIGHAILYMRLTKTEAEEKERQLIKRFNTTDRRYGYNIESGGGLGKEVSEETREKLRINASGVHPSADTRRKMSESHKGEKCHFYGKHLSEKAKRNLRNIKSKKVAQINDSGEIVRIYNSMNDAADTYGITRQAISSCCSGKTKKCVGYAWRWV